VNRLLQATHFDHAAPLRLMPAYAGSLLLLDCHLLLN
jgi:hypothetical protein